MLKSLLYNVKAVGRRAFIADKNNNVYVIKLTDNPSRYGIALAKNDEKHLVEEIDIKNPTQEQKEYALLNLILTDQEHNPSKTGFYALDMEDLCDEFILMLHDIDSNILSVRGVLDYFAIKPLGKFREIAYKNLIRDVISGRCENVDKNRLADEKRKASQMSLYYCKKAEDGYIYLAKPKTMNMGYRIIQVRPTMEFEIKEPSQEQIETALFNLIVEDNKTNLGKTGIYNKDRAELSQLYTKSLKDIENGKCNKNELIDRFALNFDKSYLNDLANKLCADVVEKRQKTANEEIVM